MTRCAAAPKCGQERRGAHRRGAPNAPAARSGGRLSPWHRRCFESRQSHERRTFTRQRPERQRMSLAVALKTLSTRQRLSEDAARHATAALLDGGVPELEQGALLALLDPPSDEVAEMSGSESALSERCFRLNVSRTGVRPVVLASHAGSTDSPNLLPLLALALQRLKLQVIVHGVLSAPGRVVAGQVFRELGVLPCVT